MRNLTRLAALIWCVASTAQAQTAVFPFVLKANEKVVVSYRAGRFTGVDIKTHADQPDMAPAPKDATAEGYGVLKGIVTPDLDDTLTFTFWTDARDGARLRLANGLSRPVIYSATMVTSDGREHPTTICSIPSGKVGFETWATNLAAIKITGVYDAPKGQEVCGYAERGLLRAPPP